MNRLTLLLFTLAITALALQSDASLSIDFTSGTIIRSYHVPENPEEILEYLEDGMTVLALGSETFDGHYHLLDGHMVTALDFTGARFSVDGQWLRLESIDVFGMGGGGTVWPFTFKSSTGTELVIDSGGTTVFPDTPDWNGIPYFDLLTGPNDLDNVTFSVVPEPSTIALIAMGLIPFLAGRLPIG